MTQIKVEVEFEVTPDMVDQILVTAFDGNYGGSLYWAEVLELKKEDHPYGRSAMWSVIMIQDMEDGEKHWVDKERLARGLKLYIENDMISEGHLADTINSIATDFDANDADIIVQMSIFEEVRYG